MVEFTETATELLRQRPADAEAEIEHWESEGGRPIASLAIRYEQLATARPVWHKDGE